MQKLPKWNYHYHKCRLRCSKGILWNKCDAYFKLGIIKAVWLFNLKKTEIHSSSQVSSTIKLVRNSIFNRRIFTCFQYAVDKV